MRKGKMRIAVTGAAGRLGATMTCDLATAGHSVIALNHSDLDISNVDAVDTVIYGLQPDVIINCSAYNAVDAAEANPARAFAVNAHGPAALAGAAMRLGALLVHYSTDFVFDGTGSEPYSEEAAPNPLNVYGASKLAGEHEVAATERHYILRVESLFGGRSVAGQKATVDFIADSLQAGGTVRAIVDRTVSPSYVRDVVRVTATLIEQRIPFGTYHCVASGSTTWYDLASEIATHCGSAGRVVPVHADEFPTVAPRPRFCALSNQKLVRLGFDMPTWKTALRQHLASRQVPARVATPLRARTA